MTLEALQEKLDAVMTAGDRAVPVAALAIAKKLQGDVSRSRAAAKRRRRAERAERKARGDSRRVKVGGRKGSGVKILAVGAGSSVVVTASAEVQRRARETGETGEWIEILREKVVDAAEGP